MGDWHGKGSSSRVSNKKRFDESFERIFGKREPKKDTDKRKQPYSPPVESSGKVMGYPL